MNTSTTVNYDYPSETLLAEYNYVMREYYIALEGNEDARAEGLLKRSQDIFAAYDRALQDEYDYSGGMETR